MNIYVVKVNDQQLFKIGITQNVKRRVYQLQTANPFIVKLLFSSVSTSALLIETYLHKRYKSKNVSGEWFTLSESDLIEMQDIIANWEEVFKEICEKEAAEALLAETVLLNATTKRLDAQAVLAESDNLKDFLSQRTKTLRLAGIAEATGINKTVLTHWLNGTLNGKKPRQLTQTDIDNLVSFLECWYGYHPITNANQFI